MAKQSWVIDPMHSEIMFKVRHMLITNVSGTFDIYKAVVRSDAPDFSDMEIEFEAEVTSVNTRNSHRDAHLRSNDFFDAENYPILLFESHKVEKTGINQFEVTGDFTIRGVTRPVTFQAEYMGTGLDLYGQRKAGFELMGTIRREDYNLNWNAASEDGTLALGEEVTIQVSAQVIKQVGQPA
jgi:polyisoprenoid-binding protein YceI